MRRSLLNQLLSDPDNVLHHFNRVPSCPCPHCGEPLNVASSEDAGKPKPGNFTVCVHCVGVCQFGPDMQLVPVTIDSAIAEGADRAELEAMVVLVKKTRKLVLLGPIEQPD